MAITCSRNAHFGDCFFKDAGDAGDNFVPNSQKKVMKKGEELETSPAVGSDRRCDVIDFACGYCGLCGGLPSSFGPGLLGRSSIRWWGLGPSLSFGSVLPAIAQPRFLLSVLRRPLQSSGAGHR